MFPFRRFLIGSAFFFGLVTSYSILAKDTGDNYDRLDGTGKSGAKVDVIEWEGNLEIHGNTPGKILGLGAKLDDRDSSKKVLVIGFRMNGVGGTLVRRATLGVPFTPVVKLFRDPTAKGYDKFAFSNQDLKAPWVPHKMDPAPKQWYPDGHPSNEDAGEPTKPQKMSGNGGDDSERAPASSGQGAANGREPASVKSPGSDNSGNDDDNQIKPYTW